MKEIIQQHPIILFDGDCLLCSGFIQWVIKHDASKRIHFAALQSSKGQQLLQAHGLPKEELQSVVLVHRQTAARHSTAVLQICRLLGKPWKYLYALHVIPLFIRDAIYRFIAARRHSWFGSGKKCLLMTANLQKRMLL
ncbi:MAG: DCC1-like thiol-disulfide oxidoreductase family protein [Bacteroidota bacterium]